MSELELGWVICFKCGDDLEVETRDGRIVTWPALCPHCQYPHMMPPEGEVEYADD